MDLSDTLSPEHVREVLEGSSVDRAVAAARGYRTLTGTGEDRDLLNSLGFKPLLWDRDDAYPGLLIPMYGADGEARGHQFKPAKPRTRVKTDGTRVPVKYETPPGAANVVDMPAASLDLLRTEPGRSGWITEGVKKVDSLVSRGMAAFGLQGVFSWRNKYGALGDWEEVPIKGRPWVVCFDSDANGNRNVQLAMSRLGAWLKSRGATTVHYLVVPAEVDGTPVKGVDDYFAAGGELEALTAAATQTAPGAGEKDAAFTDAFLVEDLAEALEGRFCWAAGLGWLRWTGQIWREVPDVEPLEAVREWAGTQFEAALTAQRKDPSRPLTGTIQGWRAILGKSRLTALRDLSRGLLQRDPADFDGDPDLLTVKNGTVHLPTGRLMEFNPAHLTTKQCDADYIPHARHPLWDKALCAIPEETHEWYRDRIGQALTGFPVPDHVLVISHGSGANGKSTLVNIFRRMVGTYGVLVSDRLLMGSTDQHPTEFMDLRGARYAVLEETPEARHLNVHSLKRTLGTERITARRIRQDPVEFITSHSLFINTNYKPVVTETDWGTWRRLNLLPYPYTFRKPGEPLQGPWERTGDPTLQYAADNPAVRRAALAWAVAGAQAWYARGRMMLETPAGVERETRKWRAETDLILGFADECLIFTPDEYVITQDMLTAFNTWAEVRGHRPWNDRTFATRFGTHDTVKGARVEATRVRAGGKQHRVWAGVQLRKPDDPWSDDLPEPMSPEGPSPEERAAADELMAMDQELFPDQYTPRTPVVLGFDLETADADKLFTGGYEGTFVRLAGAQENDQTWQFIGPVSDDYLEELSRADVIYGHNILGFDLLALAHHHGADYDALAAKAVDTMVLARLVDPPLSKGMPNGYYGLDQVAQRLGYEGKTDDLAALAKEYGGYDRIPLDARRYQDYLRGDLAATKAVRESLVALMAAQPETQQLYACREMEIVALQNRMTLNGWAVDQPLLAERVEREADQREGAVQVLATEFGMPTHTPDRFKLKPRSQWGDAYLQTKSVTVARRYMKLFPEAAVARGLAERIPGEKRAKPWSSDAGREAIENAFRAAGATSWPTTRPGPDGVLALSADALGEGSWYCKHRKRAMPGMLKVHGDKPAVRRVVENVLLATGARDKYAEIAKFLTDQGRIHSWIGDSQGSGRWAHIKPAISTMGKRGQAAAERDVLVADAGHLLITSDHSQLDVRTVAALSQDPELIGMLQPDSPDYHTSMAVVYFGDPARRNDAKPINHGVNYGQGAKAIAERNGLDVGMVAEALQARGDRFRRLMEWTQEVRQRAEAGQLLDNGFGRLMRPSPDRAYTQGPALMGQGASRDVMCESLLRLVKARPDVTPFLRAVVHDEIVLSVPVDSVEEWSEELRAAMTWEWRGVPILCDVSKPAFRWSDCK